MGCRATPIRYLWAVEWRTLGENATGNWQVSKPIFLSKPAAKKRAAQLGAIRNMETRVRCFEAKGEKP